MRVLRLRTVAGFALLGACAHRAAVPATGADGGVAGPGASAPATAQDTMPLLAPSRIAALPAGRREAWQEYLARSAAMRARDSVAILAERRAAGVPQLARPPQAGGFDVESWMTAAWFATDSARRVGERVLSFQAPNGGWSKRVDMIGRARQPGEGWASEGNERAWVSTIDNGGTTSQLQFLAQLEAHQSHQRWRDAYRRGLRYLLDAQMPNGCWPQVFPLRGGYHDAATFNDDATVRAAEVMREAGRGTPAFLSGAERASAAGAAARAVSCLLEAQVVREGRRTVWGQQHDPLTLTPVAARSYEPASLSSQESARIVRFLMRESSPDARLVAAVHDAVEWFRGTAIHGVSYTFDGGLRDAPGEGPVWARLYELGTDRPIFSNRDGIVLYDWHQLTDRRTGYGWYSYVPLSMLQAYERWAPRHPRSGSEP